MALNPQFPNYANGPAGTEVIAWTVVGGQPLYRLPVAYVDTGFGAAFVCEGSTVEAPTYPQGVYTPDPNIESPGTISGDPEVGNTLTFAPGQISGTAPIGAAYNWIRYIPGGQSVIVGTGLSYVVQIADVAHTLIVQTVAAGPTQTVATQTAPYRPCYSASPIITDPGAISVKGSFGPGYCPEPGDVLEYSGATIFHTAPFTQYISWVNPSNPDEVLQIGGDTFVIPESVVNKSVAVKVVVFAVGAPNSAQDQTNAISICGYLEVASPSKISERSPLYVGQILSGEPALFRTYGRPTVTYGFYDFTDPLNPALISSPDAVSYVVTPGDYGKRIAFITDASIGTLNARSVSQVLGPVEGYLDVVTRPTVAYIGDTVNPGTILTGTPGIFDGAPAVTSVTNAFYKNTGTSSEPVWTNIGSGVTYVVQEADAGYDIAFGSTAISPMYPGGVLSLSVPVRPTLTFVFTTIASYTNQTRPGQIPRVGDTLQMVYPESSPQNDKYGGAIPLTSSFVFKDGSSESVVATPTYTVASDDFGKDFFIRSVANYGGRQYSQVTTMVKVGGVKPSITSPGSIRSNYPANPFAPGSTAEFLKPTINIGLPANAVISWTWFMTDLGGSKVAIQNGGSFLQINQADAGKIIEVDYTITNPAGSAKATYTSSVPVPGPKIVITNVQPLNGKKNFDRNSYIDLSYINASASDGSKDPIELTSTLWLTDALGNLLYPVTTAANYGTAYRVYNTLTFEPVDLLEKPPGNPVRTPYPFVGRYAAIQWNAKNVKTGATASALSPIFGPFTADASPYGGITPPAFSMRNAGSDLLCTLTMPTFGNGGYVDVATLKVWTDGVATQTPLLISEGSLEFTSDVFSIYSSKGSWFTATIKGPSGDVEFRQAIFNP